MQIHLITAESPESRRLRAFRLIRFPQLTMPLIAALTPVEHDVRHTDEIVDEVRFDEPADLVGITAPTPSALVAGTERAARRFYSFASIVRRLAGSRTGIWWNVPRNLGYYLALRAQ